MAADEGGAILEAIKRIDGRMEGIEDGITNLHSTTGEIKCNLGIMGERIDNVKVRVDKLNGRVDSAITSASEAKAIASASGRRWGLIISAIVTGLTGIIVALIHLQGA